MENKTIVKSVSKESLLLLIGIIVFFALFISIMGATNTFKTMIATAHDLILNTSFFIMGVAILASAFSAVLSEFGIISIMNKALELLPHTFPIILQLFH